MKFSKFKLKFKTKEVIELPSDKKIVLIKSYGHDLKTPQTQQRRCIIPDRIDGIYAICEKGTYFNESTPPIIKCDEYDGGIKYIYMYNSSNYKLGMTHFQNLKAIRVWTKERNKVTIPIARTDSENATLRNNLIESGFTESEADAILSMKKQYYSVNDPVGNLYGGNGHSISGARTHGIVFGDDIKSLIGWEFLDTNGKVIESYDYFRISKPTTPLSNLGFENVNGHRTYVDEYDYAGMVQKQHTIECTDEKIQKFLYKNCERNSPVFSGKRPITVALKYSYRLPKYGTTTKIVYLPTKIFNTDEFSEGNVFYTNPIPKVKQELLDIGIPGEMADVLARGVNIVQENLNSTKIYIKLADEIPYINCGNATTYDKEYKEVNYLFCQRDYSSYYYN